MGVVKQPEPVKLFVAVMYAPGFDPGPAAALLRHEFGIEYCSYGPVDFVFSDYYAKDMGGGLKKSYHCYETPIDRGRLAAIKNRTNAIEAANAGPGGRRINIDPGYLSRDKLVLATTKDFYHRIYLGDGIHAEVTLHFREGRYRHFSWTYPDYREPDFQAMLMKARARLVHQLREHA